MSETNQSRMESRMQSRVESRSERKERTRRAILDAGLALAAESGLGSVSLRQVAKEVGVVPTAFYRHFASLDELGLALVEEAFASLRAMLRDVRQRSSDVSTIIDTSVDVLVEHALSHRAHFTFIARERVAGPPIVREQVRHDLALITRELAADVGRLPGTESWSHEDLQVLSELIVDQMVAAAERIVSTPSQSDALAERARTQLRMVVVGALQWRST